MSFLAKPWDMCCAPVLPFFGLPQEFIMFSGPIVGTNEKTNKHKTSTFTLFLGFLRAVCVFWPFFGLPFLSPLWWFWFWPLIFYWIFVICLFTWDIVSSKLANSLQPTSSYKLPNPPHKCIFCTGWRGIFCLQKNPGFTQSWVASWYC